MLVRYKEYFDTDIVTVSFICGWCIFWSCEFGVCVKSLVNGMNCTDILDMCLSVIQSILILTLYLQVSLVDSAYCAFVLWAVCKMSGEWYELHGNFGFMPVSYTAYFDSDIVPASFICGWSILRSSALGCV